MDSFELVKFDENHLPTFETGRIRMQYPLDWQKKFYADLGTFVTPNYLGNNIVTFTPKSKELRDVTLSIIIEDKEAPLNQSWPGNAEEMARLTLSRGSVINEFKFDNTTGNNGSITVMLMVTRDNVSHKIMQKYYKVDDKFIIINYEAPSSKFDTFLPLVVKSTQSLEFAKYNKKQLHTFESTIYGGLKIKYPDSWDVE